MNKDVEFGKVIVPSGNKVQFDLNRSDLFETAVSFEFSEVEVKQKDGTMKEKFEIDDVSFGELDSFDSLIG